MFGGSMRFRALVAEVVTDVREESPPWREPLHGLNGAVHGGVGGVRLISKRVEKQDVQTLQQAVRRFRDLAVIGEIGRRAETEPVNGLPRRAAPEPA